MNVPCGFANFAIDPLYSSLILNGDDWADADFIPGTTYFAYTCLSINAYVQLVADL